MKSYSPARGGAALGQTVNLLVDGAHGLLWRPRPSSFLPSFIRAPIFLDSALRVAWTLLDLGDDGTALVVELKELRGSPRRLAVSHGDIDGIGVLANKL